MSNVDRLPPASIENEKRLLATLLLDSHQIGQIQNLIGRDAFFQADHQIIYDILVKLHLQGRPIDAVILREELLKRQLLDEIGGVQYLAEILSSVPSAAQALDYARVVREKALLRQLIAASTDTIRDAFQELEPVESILDSAQSRVLSITRGDSRDVASSEEVLHEVFEAIECRGQRGIETGFYDLDDMLNGLQAGELTIIAGRPSIGKTALALNFVEHATLNSKTPCGVFTLESTKEQLAQRMLCSHCGLDSHKLRKGMLSADEYQELANVVGEMATAPLFVNSLPGATLHELTASIRRAVVAHGLKLAVIDYVQLIEAKGESRTEQLTLISRRLKALALELKISLVCISQLNRGMFQPEMPRPRMEDLRGSGTLEEEADVVMLVHRDDYYHMNEFDFVPDNIAEVIIAKQRNGPTGTVKLTFLNKSTRFVNLASHADPF